MSDPRTTTSGSPPADDHWDASAPQPINPETGQHKDHWILPEVERAKGFIRPVRLTYTHVRVSRPAHLLRDLTSEERARYPDDVKFEAYPDTESPVTGRFWSQQQLDRKPCGVATSMGTKIAETYARDPKYYGSTFCIGCKEYLSVDEFDWEDGSRLGS